MAAILNPWSTQFWLPRYHTPVLPSHTAWSELVDTLL
jgi:hypothetical protein